MRGIRTDKKNVPQWDGSVGHMPYRNGTVTFIRIISATDLDASNEIGTKREWLGDDSTVLFAAWHGKYRTDIFRVNRAAARKALA